MEYENALNFLLFSYFGFEDGVDGIKNGNDKIPYLCARRAYLDLARTVKYKYSSSVLDNMSAKKSRNEDKNEAAAFKTAKNDMIDKMCQKMLYPVEEKHCCDNEFADWHEKKCKDIKDDMNKAIYETNEPNNCIIKDKAFTYGQAQKWLNMTLKYMWLLDMLPEGLTKESLHIPIDSYIIDAVKSNAIEYGLGIKTGPSAASWSKWDDYGAYRDYQNAAGKTIREKYGLSPIEWEGKAWMATAKDKSN